MIDEDAERRRQKGAAAIGEVLTWVNDVVAQLRADLARARAEAENFRVQLIGEREARIDREAEISRLRAAACLRTPEDISDALTTAHGQGQEDAIETVAGWLGCAPKIGAIEAAIAARDVPYRKGPPSMEQIQAREDRFLGAHFMAFLDEARIVALRVRDGVIELHDPWTFWEPLLGFAWAQQCSFRPCLPNGTTCPWID